MSSTLTGHITDSDLGGFTAVASTTDVDRDGEVIDYGAFNPLPASIPVHADHVASVNSLVARAVPSYRNGRLMIEATFASTPDAQAVRQKVLDGVLDTVSVVFFNPTRKDVNGVPHVTSGELLAVDLVTVPSNRGARVLASRSFKPRRDFTSLNEFRKELLMSQIELEVFLAEQVLKSTRREELTRTKSEIREFLRKLSD